MLRWARILLIYASMFYFLTQQRPFSPKFWLLAALALAAFLLFPTEALAQSSATPNPLALAGSARQIEQGMSGPMRVLLYTTLLTFIPALVLSLTSFTRILIVFSFLKQGLGTQHAPPSTVIITMTMVLTAYVSMPFFKDLYSSALKPLQSGDTNIEQTMARFSGPLRRHLEPRVQEKDVAIFAGLRGDAGYASISQVPIEVLAPAFMLGELRTAFRMGFSILVPFVVIDLVVSALLMTLGMMMLPPVLISLPIKILVFVSVDGWSLLIASLAKGAM